MQKFSAKFLLVYGLAAALVPAFALASKDTKLRQRFRHYAKVQALSEKTLQEFDRELDLALQQNDSSFLQRSRSYRRLQALRELKHADAEEIGHTMPDFSDAQIQEEIIQLSPIEKQSAAILFSDIAKHHEDLAPRIQGKLSSAFLASNRDKFIQVAEQEATASPSEVDLEVAEIEADLDLSDVTPALSADKIRPGTGPEGNITGRGFPENTWAITYDDGPSKDYTKAIIDALGEYRVKATFFWLARNVKGNTDIVDYARSAGMSLNNHSYTHYRLTEASESKLKYEISDSTDFEARIYGARPEFFRCPYGAGVNKTNVRQKIADEKMIHVFWNADSLDWQDKNPDSVLERVKKLMQLEKKGVILFHDIHPQSLAVTKLLLESTRSRKTPIRWVTLPEIRDELNRNARLK